MIRLCKTLIFFSFAASAVGQTPDTIYKNQIKLSIFRIVDPDNPGIELNYERSHSQKFSSEFTAAYMRNIIRSGSHFEGFRIGFEEKRFLKTRITDLRAFASTQLVYNNSALRDVNNYGYDTSTRTYFNVPFKIVKKTTIFNIKVGLQFLLDHFVIDYSTGLGVKYKDIKHIGRKYPFTESGGLSFISNAEGRFWYINFPSSIKIGYRF